VASISKQPSGSWRARYRDPNGRSRSRSFVRKTDAEQFLTSVNHSRFSGTYVDPAGGRILFRTWVEQWRSGVVDLRPSTLARDDGYIARYLLPTFGECRLNEIDHTMVRSWIADLSTRPRRSSKEAKEGAQVRTLAPATVVKAAGILYKIMASAVASGLIATSPCTNQSVPRIENREMRFLSPLEISALADAIDPRYRALVILGAYGGLRIGEMLGLRAKRVDVPHAKVEVAENLVEVSGHLHFGPPKTRAGKRSVPLPKVAVAALDKHLRSRPLGPEDLLFCASEGGPVRLAGWRRRVWLPAVSAAGLAPLRPHDLRHTAVALWIAAGASPKEVAARAGHTSVVTVLDRYGHLLPGSEERLNDALDALACEASGDGLVTAGGPINPVCQICVRFKSSDPCNVCGAASDQEFFGGRRGTRTPDLSRVKAAL
jgi:integrase